MSLLQSRHSGRRKGVSRPASSSAYYHEMPPAARTSTGFSAADTEKPGRRLPDRVDDGFSGARRALAGAGPGPADGGAQSSDARRRAGRFRHPDSRARVDPGSPRGGPSWPWRAAWSAASVARQSTLRSPLASLSGPPCRMARAAWRLGSWASRGTGDDVHGPSPATSWAGQLSSGRPAAHHTADHLA